jgi:hypothetical protein
MQSSACIQYNSQRRATINGLTSIYDYVTHDEASTRNEPSRATSNASLTSSLAHDSESLVRIGLWTGACASCRSKEASCGCGRWNLPNYVTASLGGALFALILIYGMRVGSRAE